VTMTTKDGQERAFTVEENGTVSSMEVALADTPAAVQKAVKAQVGTGKLDSITRILDEGLSYEVAMTTAEGKEREFTVGATGRLQSMTVTLDETGSEAQKTIKEQIGTGKILRIERSFEGKSKVPPYQVEAIKNGKPFYFSVDPKGKFLGVDK